MQEELRTEVSQLLEEVGQLVRRGEREKAHQSSLKATSLAPNEPLAWYLRSQTAPSSEEQLMCLSRAYSLDPSFSDAKKELHTAIHGLLKQEPFLAYVHETEEFYQVRSGRDLLINIPKNRIFETPYLRRAPGFAKPAFRWLSLSLLALFLGGVGAVLFAPIAAFHALRLQTSAPTDGERVRLLIVFILAVIIWLAAIPISWLLLIRFYPS
ncbi:MAG TPA: hypothetical protein VFR47_04885 [Anaerolineales bacterium]|nr:hypothetical protein [Anaerolineales bacterium]